MTLFWLSFAGPEGNRGVIVTDAPDLRAALVKTHMLRINPGGTVASINLDEIPNRDPVGLAKDLAWPRDVLISPAELRAAGYLTDRDRKQGIKTREA